MDGDAQKQIAGIAMEGMMLQESYGQALGHPRCECHECTQARWKMSFQGQNQGALGPGLGAVQQQQQEAKKAAQQQTYR